MHLFWSRKVWDQDGYGDRNVDDGQGLRIIWCLRCNLWFGGWGLLGRWSGGFGGFGCACSDNNSA